jgi:hypothetical protein
MLQRLHLRDLMRAPGGRTRISALFPRGATLNIVGPYQSTDVDVRATNNIENGTSAAGGSYQHAFPV